MNMTTRSEARALQAALIVADPRWAAVAARDAAADGRFFYSVKTTGVYCRPSCGARPARPENVAFHASPEEAERAGFRPCRRCKPDAQPLAQRQAAQVADLCRAIEAAAAAGQGTPSLAALAEHAGLSPSHLHRTFKAVTGLTPRAWAAAHRAQRVRAALDQPQTRVTDAIYDAGYGAASRFYARADDVLGMTPTAWRAGGADTDIRFAIGDCSLGAILVARSERGVCAITTRLRKRSASSYSAAGTQVLESPDAGFVRRIAVQGAAGDV
ncbi:MAG: helix-turn-helix domain-containing protein, partial [Comamonadaceae bacterium]